VTGVAVATLVCTGAVLAVRLRVFLAIVHTALLSPAHCPTAILPFWISAYFIGFFISSSQMFQFCFQ
jgi:hypothetical protein